jgi:hypothetical protein
MEIDKSQIVELLKSRGDHEQAAEAENDLPEKVDPEKDGGLLSTFDVDPQELMGSLDGGGPGKMLGG